MEIKTLIPRGGDDTLRIGDSDDLVVMENFGALPKGKLRLNNQGLIVICTEGMAQFDYDGQQIRLRKNDLSSIWRIALPLILCPRPTSTAVRFGLPEANYGASICMVR